MNKEINDEAQMYIDIISMNPSAEKNNRYKAVLKDKYGIVYDDIDKDNYYIKNANLSEIKKKQDFLNFDNYIKYAKVIFQLRGLGNIQPNHIEGVVTIEQAKKLGSKIGLKIKHREYDGGSGNYAAHDLTDTIIMPPDVDANTFIHELGHHYDHFESNDYKGLAKTITYASSPYAIDKSNEVFAENFMHYFIAPSWLKKNLPIVYNELDKNIKPKYKQEVYNLIGNKLNEGGKITSKGTFKPLGSAKELGITPKIAVYDMIAICDCGEKFSYQNSKKDILWQCPECIKCAVCFLALPITVCS